MMLTIAIIRSVIGPTLPVLLLLLLLLPPFTLGEGQQPPNMVILMVDDLGWADVGYHDAEMRTAHIDALAREGVQLNFSYMLKSCTPSRSAFLTGYYAYRLGLQDKSLSATQNDSLPLDKRLFPQDLQDHGYSTHFVGKWHLGFCKRQMTPTYRGFDTFYGMYNGVGDHYSHVSKKNGYDLQDNKGLHDFQADKSARGTYSTTLFTNKAVEIINNHDASKPLFLFLSYQAVHGPFQVPEHYVTKYCAHVTTGRKRKVHCAMTAAVDEGIGEVMAALKGTGLYDNLITLFISDNGGPVKHGSSNWPLRGSKITEWEGGTRVVSILHSEKHLPNAPYTWNGLIHAVDWYPTLLSAANIPVNKSGMDGIDNWNRIARNKNSKREEFVYNINEVKKNFALRWRQYKLVKFRRAKPDGWFNPPPGQVPIPPPKANRRYMLFDIELDPAERHDLSKYNKTYKLIKKRMIKKLKRYKQGLVRSRNPSVIKAGYPKNHKGLWTTDWC